MRRAPNIEATAKINLGHVKYKWKLLYEHCNYTSHTKKKSYKLVRYPPNQKSSPNIKQSRGNEQTIYMKTSSNKNKSAYTLMPNNIATSSETCSSPLY